MSRLRTIAIIGAGASGMLAACIAASAPGTKVLLFEKQSRVGKKISVTGNGRCNLSNSAVALSAYHGKDSSFASIPLSDFSVENTLAFFKSLGLLTITESDGRIYPYSDSANSVVDVLRFALTRLNVELFLDAHVKTIKKIDNIFHIAYNGCIATADKVIVACGGLAGRKVGGCTDGYDLLSSFGHSVSDLRPALVQLKSSNTYVKALKGVRATSDIFLYDSVRQIGFAHGEVQFTDYGLSGPAVFDISRVALQCGLPELHLDLLPTVSARELIDLLSQRVLSHPELSLADLFTGILHNRLGRVIVQYSGYNINEPLSDISNKDLNKLASSAKCFVHVITGDMGFDNAQVTAGGILTKDFNPSTLESYLVSGLYAVGEVFDIDGDCGGYNLQWAWSSGYIAGKAASQC